MRGRGVGGMRGMRQVRRMRRVVLGRAVRVRGVGGEARVPPVVAPAVRGPVAHRCWGQSCHLHDYH